MQPETSKATAKFMWNNVELLGHLGLNKNAPFLHGRLVAERLNLVSDMFVGDVGNDCALEKSIGRCQMRATHLRFSRPDGKHLGLAKAP